MTRRAIFAAILAVGVATSGCSMHGLSFVQDNRIAITQPRSRASVQVPFELQWITKRDAPASSYAIFIDGSPQPAGRTVAWMFRNTDACRRVPRACPTAQMLVDAGIVLTTGTHARITAVAHRRSSEARRPHRVTVVVLDDAGRRIGENAQSIDFFVRPVKDEG